MSRNEQSILFLSDKSSEWIMENYKAIKKAGSMGFDVFFLYHKRDGIIPEGVTRQRHFCFTDSILSKLGYMPLADSLVPGSNHFPLLKFYLENPHYDYYWLVEDDVYFTGNWKKFFEAFNNDTSDFISTEIRNFNEMPFWYWWWSLQRPVFLKRENLYRSFNPLYRLSNKALQCLNIAYLSGWSGHHEVTIPTILHNAGFTMRDIGGVGSFVPAGSENRFYDHSSWFFLPLKLGNKPNFLYHPIKEKTGLSAKMHLKLKQ